MDGEGDESDICKMIEQKFTEEGYIETARQLNQWDLISSIAKSTQRKDLILESLLQFDNQFSDLDINKGFRVDYFKGKSIEKIALIC